MQPETSAQYQHRFSQAIRGGEAADGLPQDRLNVYIRLIRNNIHSFIDRCYTETRQYFDSKEWSRLKEGFVRDARAQTPYFQEIPGEFLQYCQSLPLSDGILALMDFEYTNCWQKLHKFRIFPTFIIQMTANTRPPLRPLSGNIDTMLPMICRKRKQPC